MSTIGKNPWVKLPNQEPFVLEAENEKPDTLREKYNFVTNRLPEPFIGNIDAELVILNLNPGGDVGNGGFNQTSSVFAEAVRANLKLSKSVEYPFYYLNPALKKHPGAKWWKAKLKEFIAGKTELEVFEKTLAVSKKILAVEFCGYPSKEWNSAINKARFQGDEFRNRLVERAIKRGAQIIVMKGLRLWIEAIPKLEHYKNTWVLYSPQNSNISQKNLMRPYCGDGAWKKILECV